MLFAPLEGWRHVEVTDRRAATDYAAILKDLSDRHFPDASQIVLVQDNLSTHTVASLYAGFAPAEARRLAGTLRVALHPEARKLARYGGVRTRSSVIAMSGPASSRQGDPHRGSRRMADTPEQTQHESQLAIHQRPCPDQTQAPLPVTLDATCPTSRHSVPRRPEPAVDPGAHFRHPLRTLPNGLRPRSGARARWAAPPVWADVSLYQR